MLLLDSGVDLRQPALDQSQGAARVLDLVVVHQGSGLDRPPAGPAHHGQGNLQVAPQGGGRRGSRGRFQVPLGSQKQLGLFQKALASDGRALAPGGVKLPGFPGGEVVPGEGRRHLLAILQAEACRRHQVLHGQMRGDLALAHLLLDGLGEKLDQSQPPRDPTEAAVQAAGQFRLVIAEALLQFGQQPALFQRGFRLGPAPGAVQQQSLGGAHRPDHCFDRVLSQLLERGDALEAVDDQVAAGLTVVGHHHDGRLLAAFGERGQQPPLPLGMPHPQMLQPPVQLVKLQLHGSLRGTQYGAARNGSFAGEGEVCRHASRNQPHRPGTGLSPSVGGVQPK